MIGGDESVFFQHATRILSGQVPFRDFFLYITPGTDFLFAAIFRIFGVHMWVAQGIVAGLGLALAWVTAWMSRAVLDGPVALLPGLLFLVLDFNNSMDATHHWFSTLFVMVAAGVLLGGRSFGRLAVAGALCGVATLFTQTHGALGFIAIGLYLVLTRHDEEAEFSRQIVTFVLPFAVIVSVVLVYYAVKAGWRTEWYDLITFPLKYYPEGNASGIKGYFMQVPALRLSNAGQILPYIFIHLLVPFVYPVCLVRMLREKAKMDRRQWNGLLLINLIGLGEFIAILGGPTYHRMCMVAPPAILVCVWLCSGGAAIERFSRQLLWALGIALFFIFPIRLQVQHREYLNLPAGRTGFVDPAAFEMLNWFAPQVRTDDSFFFNTPVSFALQLQNPTAIDLVAEDETTRPEQVSGVVHSLEEHQTRFVFLNVHTAVSHGPGDNLGPLREYVHNNYHLLKTFSSGEFWQRN